jgi:hypothetical protein
LIMNNFILETFVQILHFSVYPAKLMIDKYGDEVLRELEEEKQNKEELSFTSAS